MKAYVYALYNSEMNHPFYIGCTVNPKQRFHVHLSQSKRRKLSGSTTVKEISMQGEAIIMMIAYKGSIQKAKMVEGNLIQLLLDNGVSLENKGKIKNPKYSLKCASGCE